MNHTKPSIRRSTGDGTSNAESTCQHLLLRAAAAEQAGPPPAFLYTSTTTPGARRAGRTTHPDCPHTTGPPPLCQHTHTRMTPGPDTPPHISARTGLGTRPTAAAAMTLSPDASAGRRELHTETHGAFCDPWRRRRETHAANQKVGLLFWLLTSAVRTTGR